MAGKICCCADFEQNQGKRNCGILIRSWTHGGTYLLLSADRLISLVFSDLFLFVNINSRTCAVCVWSNHWLWQIFINVT